MTTTCHRLAPPLLALALLAAADTARAQPGPTGGGPGGPSFNAPHGEGGAQSAGRHTTPVAMRRDATRAQGAIDVRSPQLASQAAIPARHTAYGDNISPALEWSPVDGARSYVVLLEDPDAPRAQPFAHWVAWNIPPDVHALPERIPAIAMPASVPRMRQGGNDRGTLGYFGPRPPAGDAPHHYHFQVFALDRSLDLPPGATREQLLGAMAGHVLAKGELVATSEAPRGH